MTNKPFLVEYFYKFEKEKANKPFFTPAFWRYLGNLHLGRSGGESQKISHLAQKTMPKENAHISVVSKNCREWLIADIAIMMAGFVSVPFYANLKGEQLREVIELGDVDLIAFGKSRWMGRYGNGYSSEVLRWENSLIMLALQK